MEVWVVIVADLVAWVVDIACIASLLVTTTVPSIAVIVGAGVVIVAILVG